VIKPLGNYCIDSTARLHKVFAGGVLG